MIRCITESKEVMYASECDEAVARELSERNNLLCPNCNNPVQFKKGPKVRPHFAHKPNSDCIVTNYEKETEEHILGKEILLGLLRERFPEASVESEVYIKETKQIADILITHVSKGAEGKRWAFEFQHSPLSDREWEDRHNLYQTEGIHDFWIFDAGKFLKYSKARDIEHARLRHEPVKIVFENIGFCYFLKLDTCEMTIDFKFRYEDKYTEVRGRRHKNEYTFHNPIDHSCKLDNIKYVYNEEFNFAAMGFEDVREGVIERFDWRVEKFEKEKQQRWEEELQLKARQKWLFAKDKYGEAFSMIVLSLMKGNKEETKQDVFDLSEEDFIRKYNSYFRKIDSNNNEIENWKVSENTNQRALRKMLSNDEIVKLSSLKEQNTLTLEDFLTDKYSKRIELINYVLIEYNDVLGKLTSYNPKIVSKMLSDVNWRLNPYKEEPTKFDYAYEYQRYKTREDIDIAVKEIQDKIIIPIENPFLDLEGL